MHIGSDMTEKTSDISKVINSLNFTFSIKPFSIPFNTRYGIEINATTKTLADVASIECNKTISSLSIKGLSIDGITSEGRQIQLKLTYKDVALSQKVSYTLNGGN